MEDAGDETELEDMYETIRGRGDRWTGLTVVTVTLSFLKILEGDEVLHASEGQKGRLPRENCPAELMNGRWTCTRQLMNKRGAGFQCACEWC